MSYIYDANLLHYTCSFYLSYHLFPAYSLANGQIVIHILRGPNEYGCPLMHVSGFDVQNGTFSRISLSSSLLYNIGHGVALILEAKLQGSEKKQMLQPSLKLKT